MFHRGQTPADLPSAVKHILGDYRALSEYSPELRRSAPDVVLDMIPATEQNAQNVMRVFKGFAPRVVAISSGDVYRAFARIRGKESGPVDPVPLAEDAPLREQLYPYREETARSDDDSRAVRWMDDYDKILVERVVMGEPELVGTVLRLAAVHGPGDRQHRLFFYLRRMDDNRPVILLDAGEARWRWARVYVENAAAAIALAVEDNRAARRIYNVAEPEAPSQIEWVERVGKAAGWKGRVVVIPEGRLPPHLKVGVKNATQDLVLDTIRIRTELGYREIIRPDEALRRTVEWERVHPPQGTDSLRFDYLSEDKVLALGGT